MTFRFLLAVQTALLPAGTSAPGRPAAMGVVVDAFRAHLGGGAISPGATVYDGDHFSTDEGGALQLRCNAALLELAEKSAVLVHRVGNEAPDAKTEAELVEGTLVFRRRPANWKSRHEMHTFAPLEMGERRRR